MLKTLSFVSLILALAGCGADANRSRGKFALTNVVASGDCDQEVMNAVRDNLYTYSLTLTSAQRLGHNEMMFSTDDGECEMVIDPSFELSKEGPHDGALRLSVDCGGEFQCHSTFYFDFEPAQR